MAEQRTAAAAPREGDRPPTAFYRGTAPANKDGGFPVSLWEVDDSHPNGEVYIAGPTPVEAAETAGITGALNAKAIEKCDAPPPAAPAPTAPAAPAPKTGS